MSSVYICQVCETEYNEEKEGKKWADLPDSWVCPVCESGKKMFSPAAAAAEAPYADPGGDEIPERLADELEFHMADIHKIAESGNSIIEPMRTQVPCPVGWDDILIKGAQIARLPLNSDQPVNLTTRIGPKAKQPLTIETPVIVSHMSFGALSKEAKIALAKGSGAAKTAMCSGEGGILPESLKESYRYIFEYVPNRYSVTEENLQSVDAIEIKLGQSTKPGMGGHLPGSKVTEEIARIRGFNPGEEIISPSHFPDIRNGEELKKKVAWLRDISAGKPIGVKIAAGHIEDDLKIILDAEPDFITIDGRAGATGASPKFLKAAASIPTLFALSRARSFLDKQKAEAVTLIVTGGLRVSSDIVKAVAMGADAVALATAALMAIGCHQFRICDTGKCPRGITSQEPHLRKRLDIEAAARGLENFLNVTTQELASFSRITGNNDIHNLSLRDLCTTSSEISTFTNIEHV